MFGERLETGTCRRHEKERLKGRNTRGRREEVNASC
jgi:hypothetical protein